MKFLLMATRNRHKADEIRAVLGEAIGLMTLADFPTAPSVIEDAGTFAGNAQKKAVELAVWLAQEVSSADGRATLDPIRISVDPVRELKAFDRFVLADDSGLEVDALAGAPGVHSARFAALDAGAAGNASDAANNVKLLRLLAEVPWQKRTARFRCVIALTPVFSAADPDVPRASQPRELKSRTLLFDGACEGHLAEIPRGQGGFGYDPLFIPLGFTETFAELGASTKNQISHRARALAKLKDHWDQ